MVVKVKLFATLRQYITDNDQGICDMTLPENCSVLDVLAALQIPDDIPKIFLINGNQKERDALLQTGDTLSIFPPIAGG
ncbi:MoaD/ThiS family protein [Thermodesulfobacteriota bacterium]